MTEHASVADAYAFHKRRSGPPFQRTLALTEADIPLIWRALADYDPRHPVVAGVLAALDVPMPALVTLDGYGIDLLRCAVGSMWPEKVDGRVLDPEAEAARRDLMARIEGER